MKAFWPRLAHLKEQNTTEARKEVDQTTETEDQELENEGNAEGKAREIGDLAVEEVVKDRGADGGDESLQVSTDKEIRSTDEKNHAMEELKQNSGGKRVQNVMEKEDLGNEEKQEKNEKKVAEINQEVEKVASSSKRGEEELMENLEIDQIGRKRHNLFTEEKSHDQDGDKCAEDQEPGAKRRKVIIGDKKLLKRQAKKAKGEKRRVRQRRAKQLRSNFLSTQGNLQALQSGWITEQETAVAIKDLKSEVLVIGLSTTEINRKLEISLLNQVFSNDLFNSNHKYYFKITFVFALK